jgi:hypothetical protein
VMPTFAMAADDEQVGVAARSGSAAWCLLRRSDTKRD